MFTVMRRICQFWPPHLESWSLPSRSGHKVEPSPALEEIVVTARKRNENLQDVPVTMDVFTPQEDCGGRNRKPRDFIAMVPNMTLVETQNIGNSFITIRGISQARTASLRSLCWSMACRRPIRTSSTKNSTTFKQIEVLKGPQGALVRTRCHRRRDHHSHRRSVRSFRGEHPSRRR